MPRSPTFRRWMVTIPNPGFPVNELPTTHPYLRYAVWQLEIAPTTGTPHIQLYAEFSRAVSRHAVSRLWPNAHIEKAQGHRDTCRDYCSKEDTRDPNPGSGPFTFGEFQAGGQGARTDLEDACKLIKEGGLKRLIEEMPVCFVKFTNGFRQYADALEAAKRPSDAAFQPRAWQQRILDTIRGPADDRTIVWVTDTVGNSGKSRLARHIVLEHDGILLTGRIQDMMYLYNKERVVIFDVTRAAADCTNHLYTMAEMLKNGIFTSTKYQPVQKIFDPPHVIFFANFSWDREKFSHDRITEIDLAAPQPAQVAPALQQQLAAQAQVFM